MSSTVLLPLCAALTGAPDGSGVGCARRRLWELPVESHDLLLGLTFDESSLRDLAQRGLTRFVGGRCVLRGGHSDLLYSIVRDLTARNPLSECIHDALQRRHAAAVQRWRRLRESQALQRAWEEARQNADLAAPLWAVLTHPLGRALESQVLYEARTAVLARAREGRQAQARDAMRQQSLDAARALTVTLQQRLQALHGERVREAHAHADALAALRGALKRAEKAAVAVVNPQSAPACPQEGNEPSSGLTRPALVARETAGAVDRHGAIPPVPTATVRSQAWFAQRSAAQSEQGIGLAIDASSAPEAPAVSGRRLLCVGGIPGARQRYRSLVESAGARFDYHDGGIEDHLSRLDGLLRGADIVICHSGCINHEAYLRIKRHCQRQSKPCIYLERSGLTHFARKLGLGGQAATPV